MLYLVRHGQSEWNRIGRIQGRSESPLTDLGREQAAALGRMLRAVLPDPGLDIVASPLARAFETAEIIAGELGRTADEVRADRRINDFDVGVLAGYPGWDAVAADHPELARLRLEDPIRFQPPGGESGADVLARARDFLAEREAVGRDTLVVCHGVINKFIRAAAARASPEEISSRSAKIRRWSTGSTVRPRPSCGPTATPPRTAMRFRAVRRYGTAEPGERFDGDGSTLRERRTVRVDLAERGYDIVIGDRLLETAEDILAPVIAGRRTVVVTDAPIRDMHLPGLAAALDRLGIRWDAVTIPAGEGAKSFRELEALLERLLDLGVDRSTVLVAFGGGVVGDVAGFAAALFMRGIDLVQIPTTLMSQVDSAVGGKNAINTRHGKNLVGTFHQPKLVLNDVSVLASLPRRELLSGYGEIVKCALIRGEAQFGWLEGKRPGAARARHRPADRGGAARLRDEGADRDHRRTRPRRPSAGEPRAHLRARGRGRGGIRHAAARRGGCGRARRRGGALGEARPLRSIDRRTGARPPAKQRTPGSDRGARVEPGLGAGGDSRPHGPRQEDRPPGASTSCCCAVSERRSWTGPYRRTPRSRY